MTSANIDQLFPLGRDLMEIRCACGPAHTNTDKQSNSEPDSQMSPVSPPAEITTSAEIQTKYHNISTEELQLEEEQKTPAVATFIYFKG